MTTKQMESLNRRNRIVRSLLARACKYEIAKREGITTKYVEYIGNEEGIMRCNHARAGHKCIPPGVSR